MTLFKKRQIEVSNVILLPEKDSGIQNLLVRLNGVHINGYFKRREPVVIENQDSGEKIIRYVMGHGQLTGLTKDTVAVDYDGMISLGFSMKKRGQSCNLIVRKPRYFETYLFFTKHPDLGIQLSIKLGLIGCCLGFIGLLLGAVSLF